jgi:hypothetical protein
VTVGFGVKVMPTGRVSFIVEARIRGGSSKRITLGQSPAMSAIAARARVQGTQRTSHCVNCDGSGQLQENTVADNASKSGAIVRSSTSKRYHGS